MYDIETADRLSQTTRCVNTRTRAVVLSEPWISTGERMIWERRRGCPRLYALSKQLEV